MNQPRAYYNEHDKFAAQWLRNLITAGHIAPGDVDERDIRDVTPHDVRGYTQCHFFAGIGVWSYALRRAGWPDSRPVWTGSCPCQPFSASGRGEGFADERHLWPHWHYLIEQCRPPKIFGEQVASKDGLGWLDLVHSDMEGTAYAFGASDQCAAGFGAPHIRQRIYWCADAESDGRGQIDAHGDERFEGDRSERWTAGSARSGGLVFVDHNNTGLEGHAGHGDRTGGRSFADRPASEAGSISELADGAGAGQQWWWSGEARNGRGAPRLEPKRLRSISELANTYDDEQRQGRGAGSQSPSRNEPGPQSGRRGAALHNTPTGPVNGFWRNADWLLCRDGKWRPVRSGSFPLVNGAASRVGRLRAYGNAIVAEQATAFIEDYLDAEAERRGLRLNLDATGVFA